MKNSFNRTILIGRLGDDPVMENPKHKRPLCRFNVSNSTVRDGHEEVLWHKVAAVGKQADVCAAYLHKGDLVCIEGQINREAYIDKNETKHHTLIIAERITFLRTAKPTNA